jgi:large subunit ribosomal protein L21
MYAIIQTGGKQYKVAEGTELKVESLTADEGAVVEFDQVLLVANGDAVQVGAPMIKGAKVAAEVITHGRRKKIEILKFKRRKHHMKRMGHRQNFTKIKITKIEGV